MNLSKLLNGLKSPSNAPAQSTQGYNQSQNYYPKEAYLDTPINNDATINSNQPQEQRNFDISSLLPLISGMNKNGNNPLSILGALQNQNGSTSALSNLTSLLTANNQTEQRKESDSDSNPKIENYTKIADLND